MPAQQVHGGIKLRHALMRSIIAVGMVDGGQNAIFGADRLYVGPGIGGKTHDMQGFVKGRDPAIKRLERQIIDDGAQTFEFLARLQKFDRWLVLPLFHRVGFFKGLAFGGKDIGLFNAHLDLALVKMKRHVERLAHRDDRMPRWQTQLQPWFAPPGAAFGGAGFQDDGFAITGGRITRILVILNRALGHNQHDGTRQIGGIHTALGRQRQNGITENR